MLKNQIVLIKKLIQNNELKDALATLIKAIEHKRFKKEQNITNVLSRRLQQLHKDFNDGIINYDTFTVECNRITKSITELIDRLESEVENNPKERIIYYPYFLVGLGILVFIMGGLWLLGNKKSCQEQSQKILIHIANFTKSDDNTLARGLLEKVDNYLYNSDQSLNNHEDINTLLLNKFVIKNDNQVIEDSLKEKYCTYAGILVRGEKLDIQDNTTFSCWLSLSNLPRPDTIIEYENYDEISIYSPDNTDFDFNKQSDSIANFITGIVFYHLGKHNQAIDNFTKCLKHKISNAERFQFYTSFYLGNAYTYKSQEYLPIALKYYKRADKIFKNNPNIQERLSFIRQKLLKNLNSLQSALNKLKLDKDSLPVPVSDHSTSVEERIVTVEERIVIDSTIQQIEEQINQIIADTLDNNNPSDLGPLPTDVNLTYQNISNKISETLENSTNRNLPQKVISDIIAFTIKDQTTPEERGNLLKTIIKQKINDETYTKILTEAYFQGADLKQSNLSQVKLQNINLREANLNQANLQSAQLINANLQNTKLISTKLNQANLQYANLYGANLSNANLNGTNLSGANLNQVILIGTKISDEHWFDSLEKEGVKGLDRLKKIYEIKSHPSGKGYYLKER